MMVDDKTISKAGWEQPKHQHMALVLQIEMEKKKNILMAGEQISEGGEGGKEP